MGMEVKSWGIVIILFTTLLTSSAQILLKLGVNKSGFSFINLAANYYLIFGFFLYGVAGILTISAFRKGEVSVLYPIFATSYVWVAFLSNYLLKEELSLFRWFGIILIVFGVSLLGFSSRKESKVAI